MREKIIKATGQKTGPMQGERHEMLQRLGYEGFMLDDEIESIYKRLEVSAE
jgi:hypothetical protein